MRIIVTDLSRFKNQEIVCVAGICPDTGLCVRPDPYLSRSKCRKLNILPGAILEGDFTSKAAARPHTEDHSYSKLSFCGPCTGKRFHRILLDSAVPSVEKGFAVSVPNGQKCIPVNTPPEVSIITIPIKPECLTIVRDRYNVAKLKAHIRDSSGREFNYVPITDLGFWEHAISRSADDAALRELNNFVRRQEEVFVRVGLSREYESPDGRRGFWMQANGIYTFPDYPEDIRCHSTE